MRVRGTQKQVKQIEVNVDTVYIRNNITRINEDDFKGWEYDETTCDVKEYVENLSNIEDVGAIAMLMSMTMGEIDFLRKRVEDLEGGAV